MEIVTTHNMRVNIEGIKENVLGNNISAQTERQLHLTLLPFTNDLAQQSLRWTAPVAHLSSNKQVANCGLEPSTISVSRTSILKWPLYDGLVGQFIPLKYMNWTGLCKQYEVGFLLLETENTFPNHSQSCPEINPSVLLTMVCLFLTKYMAYEGPAIKFS